MGPREEDDAAAEVVDQEVVAVQGELFGPAEAGGGAEAAGAVRGGRGGADSGVGCFGG